MTDNKIGAAICAWTSSKYDDVYAARRLAAEAAVTYPYPDGEYPDQVTVDVQTLADRVDKLAALLEAERDLAGGRKHHVCLLCHQPVEPHLAIQDGSAAVYYHEGCYVLTCGDAPWMDVEHARAAVDNLLTPGVDTQAWVTPPAWVSP